jgi:hypothetical protein
LFFFQVGSVALAAVVTVERIEAAVEALEAPSVAEVGASDSEVAGLDESTSGLALDVEGAVFGTGDDLAIVDLDFFEACV